MSLGGVSVPWWSSSSVILCLVIQNKDVTPVGVGN